MYLSDNYPLFPKYDDMVYSDIEQNSFAQIIVQNKHTTAYFSLHGFFVDSLPPCQKSGETETFQLKYLVEILNVLFIH